MSEERAKIIVHYETTKFTPSIQVYGLGEFQPQPDMTPVECAYAMQFFFYLEHYQPMFGWDHESIKQWAVDHGLERNFKP